MGTDELCLQSISALATRIKRRELSPVEVTQAYLDRVQTVDGMLNSFMTVTAERALQIVGKLFDEATSLRVGQAYETPTDWHKMRPPLRA